MRKATSIIVGVTSAVALGASWAAGLAPTRPDAVTGVHLLAAGPPTATRETTPAGSAGATAPAARSGSKAAGAAPAKGGSSTGTATAPKATPRAAPVPVSGSIVGGAASTPFGVVQVKVSYTGTRITSVRAVHLTDSSQHSVSISNRAAPVLRQEAMAAQSATIDVVSGATYTSEGYIQSLQSAIDAAHLG
ncbi:MAG: FMN-binding protein [Humibacillus sp.]|nr:FMN-binding protein [Humibacillus sp.]